MTVAALRRRLRRYRAVRASYALTLRMLRRGRRLIDREPLKVATYLGHRFVYPSDSMIGRHVARHGEWDSILGRIVELALSRDDPFICEVGSNIGASLLQILAVKPRAHVLALEPSDEFRALLQTNLAAAGHAGVRVLAAFAGASAGSAWLYKNETTASGRQAVYADHESRGRQRVEVLTLDDLLHEEARVDFIKIDTDGFDFEVLKGATRTLERFRPLLFFEVAPELTQDPELGLRDLQAAGYTRFTCLSPGQHASVVGVTEDPGEVLAWARDGGYCDVLTSHGSAREMAARLQAVERAPAASGR
ncbi:MAG TPA: FkbM family methyltransferase [Candidatus Dormibacteraeota bacterium]|nr:FkbM family methyltransferase [Candidatus Dormibacteraeota bacterium]